MDACQLDEMTSHFLGGRIVRGVQDCHSPSNNKKTMIFNIILLTLTNAVDCLMIHKYWTKLREGKVNEGRYPTKISIDIFICF